MRIYVLFGIMASITFFSLTIASAFSVATLYGENYPLALTPGEEKETFFLIRNIVEGDRDVNVAVELTKGKEIAVLIGSKNEYKISYGEEVEVPIRIKIPDNAIPGARYTVGAVFKPFPGEAGVGNIQFLVNIGKSFPVIIKDTEIRETLTSRITIEEDQGLVETFAPYLKGSSGILLITIFFLMLAIFIVVILIVYFVVKGRSETRIVQIQQPTGQSFY